MNSVQPASMAKVEIERATLMRLLQNRQLCADELRCLDAGSKALLWNLCLHASQPV